MDENNTNQAQNNGTQQEVQPQQTATQEVKPSASANNSTDDTPKFSQSQLNAIIKDRVSTLNQKITDLNSQLNIEKGKVADLTSKVEDFTNKDLVNKQGIPEQFADYAIFEAKKLTADGKKTFEDAIKEVATKNASMFGIQTASNGQGNNNVNNPNSQSVTQPVYKGNSSTQGGNAQANTIDAQVQAFLESKKKRR